MALAGLSAVFLFEMLDNSILNVALPTIGRELHASTTALQWVTGAYAVVFGGLMLAFGAIADRFGRRRIMLIGLALLGVASLATAFVTTAEQLIAVRAAMGVAAAMTTPGIDGAGLPAVRRRRPARPRDRPSSRPWAWSGSRSARPSGGFVLAVAPWQVLLLVNVPIAVLAIVGVRFGIAADDAGRPAPRSGRRRRARCWARRRSCSRSSRRRCSSNEGAGSWAPVGGHRGGRRGGDLLRPPRAFGAPPAARPRSSSPTRWSPAAWRSRPRPGWRPPASATW